MLISVIVVITILNVLQYRLLPKIDSARNHDRKNMTGSQSERHPPSVKNQTGNQNLYVFGMLLSQGLN
jgi:hypothetical protein